MCQWPLAGDGGVPTLFGFTSTTKPSTNTFTCSLIFGDLPLLSTVVILIAAGC